MNATFEGFVRAIHEGGADPLPRLLFADWLEEQGCLEQAEWLRADLRLAQAFPDGDPEDARVVRQGQGPAGVPSLWLVRSIQSMARTFGALFHTVREPLGQVANSLVRLLPWRLPELPPEIAAPPGSPPHLISNTGQGDAMPMK